MRTFWFIIPLSLLIAAHALADTITLKTGEVLTGTIKNTTDTEVTIDVQVSDSITDERVIEKTDIATLSQEQPDDIAYKQLIQVQPNPQSSYSSDSYTQILTSLNNFETTYPTSTHLADIKKLADEFTDEKKHVDAGQFKYLGQWISHDEAERRRPQIEAQQLFATMQQQATGGDFVGAMQTFSTLNTAYKSTRVYPPAVALAQQILARLLPELASRMAALKANEAQMQKTIMATAEPEKSNLIAQNKAEQDRAAAVVAQAVRSGARWVPLIPDSEVSIGTLQKVAATDAQNLASVPVAAMMQSIAKTDAAHAAMATQDYTSANADLQAAVTLWSQNEDARYTLEQLKTAVGTPTPAPTVAKATPKPIKSPTPQMVNIITPPPAPEEKSFFMTVPGALAIVAVVLILGGVAAIAAKKKKDEPEE